MDKRAHTHGATARVRDGLVDRAGGGGRQALKAPHPGVRGADDLDHLVGLVGPRLTSPSSAGPMLPSALHGLLQPAEQGPDQ